MDERRDLAAGGWHPDPLRRFEFRWFNGQQWTADVAIGGERFVDHGFAPLAVAQLPPSRTLAILAFLFGLGSLLVAWMPFVVVIALLGAIAAIVLGIVAVRRARNGRAAGRGLAVAGLATAFGAIALSPLGFVLTAAVVREFEAYDDPGPLRATIDGCTADGAEVDISGSITNRDDDAHDYVIEVDIGDARGRRASSSISIDDVEPGERRGWTDQRRVIGLDDASVTCTVRDVTGPFPFGFDIEN